MSTTQEQIQQAAERVGPAVVGLGRGARRGSGVIIAAGRVITLARNLRGERVSVTLSDGRTENAELAGSDPDLDLAVLTLDTGELPAAEWGPDSAPLALGTPVTALADPGGRGLRVTAGHVSARPRSFRGARGRLVNGIIEHTAPLPRGSGGGPLVDAEGRVLGLNAVRLDGGLILALPAAELRQRSEDIAAGRAAPPRRLGVAIVPPRGARRLRRAVGLPERDGLLVRGVQDASAADRAGLARGDLIVTAAGRELKSVDDLYAVLDETAPEAPLTLGIVRGTDERELTVEARS